MEEQKIEDDIASNNL